MTVVSLPWLSTGTDTCTVAAELVAIDGVPTVGASSATAAALPVGTLIPSAMDSRVEATTRGIRCPGTA
ncbi:hypothetical protein GCM10027448_13460 [Nocardioides dilutus]